MADEGCEFISQEDGICVSVRAAALSDELCALSLVESGQVVCVRLRPEEVEAVRLGLLRWLVQSSGFFVLDTAVWSESEGL